MTRLLATAAGVLLAACAGQVDQATVVDREWTAADEAALAELEAAFAESRAVARPQDIDAAGPPAAGHGLEVYVFSIGQADAMLVRGPAPEHRTLLIDLGEPTGGSWLPYPSFSSADHVLDRIRAITDGESRVDYFLLTHYHSDHAGYGSGSAEGWGTGIIRLLSDFQVPFTVGEFIHVGAQGGEFMKAESSRGIYKTIHGRMPLWLAYGRVEEDSAPRFGTGQIDLGEGVTVEILGQGGLDPEGSSIFERAKAAGVDFTPSKAGDENDLSIALEISLGDFELFTAGDLNGTDDEAAHPIYVDRGWGYYANVEGHLVRHWERTGRESDVEIYRVNHHGSAYSSTPSLLEALDPEFVLYSTGADHGHPHRPAIERCARTARQFATSWVDNYAAFLAAGGRRVGEIQILVAPDGSSYTIEGERHLSYSDADERAGRDEGEEHREH